MSAAELESLFRAVAALGPLPDYLKEPADQGARRLREEAERRLRPGETIPTPSGGPGTVGERPRKWGIELGPRHPGRILLATSEPEARNILRQLVYREIEDAMGLTKTLTAARLARWATDRLCGPEPLPEAHRRLFVTLVAEVIREVRGAEAARSIHRDRRPSERTTLAEHAQGVPLTVIASQESEAAVGLAEASRKLTDQFPELGDLLLLHCYGGLTLKEMTDLTGQGETAVKEGLADASDWVLAQTV